MARPACAARVQRLISAYRTSGHCVARVDPLFPSNPRAAVPGSSSLGLKATQTLPPDVAAQWDSSTVGDLEDKLSSLYCGSLALEVADDDVGAEWLHAHLTSPPPTGHRLDQRRALDLLLKADELESFMDRRYSTTKRYGGQGLDSFGPLLDALLAGLAAEHQGSVKEVTVAMQHRGRLTYFCTVLGKSLAASLAEINGAPPLPDGLSDDFQGDVPFHLGHEAVVSVGRHSHQVRVSVPSNPSHLEVMPPVVLGRARAKRGCATPLLLHTDGGMSGQGIVYETLQLSRLAGYRTGEAAIHVVANNQIAFTTEPSEGRSARHSSAACRVIGIPVLYVNADALDDVLRAARIAVGYRRKFGAEICIELIGYRRQGHNEVDEPRFTQPVYQQRINSKEPSAELYSRELVELGVVTEKEVAEARHRHRSWVESADDEARQRYEPGSGSFSNSPSARWAPMCNARRARSRSGGIEDGIDRDGDVSTGVDVSELRRIARVMYEDVGHSITLHPKVETQLAERLRAMGSDSGGGDGHVGAMVSWAGAEALALASLVDEGFGVRLSGEDVGRGTFSQRHAAVWDQQSGERHVLLERVAAASCCDREVSVVDSPLTELATLAFEYGFASTCPHTLVLWEAQFGDFVNCAQVVVDEFVSSSEGKFLRQCGLVLLLPHGADGAGPNHSSARPERFLQLCAQNNMRVANCTTAANYFHVLRRQILEPARRRPLVLFTPKSTLRSRLVQSPLQDLGLGSEFRPVLPDSLLDERCSATDKACFRRVVLCTGKIALELLESRKERGLEDVAIIRLEQLYPFPHNELCVELAKFSAETEVVWCQEEPRNGGAFNFVRQHLWDNGGGGEGGPRALRYVGRPERSAPAGGVAKWHKEEQVRILDEALS